MSTPLQLGGGGERAASPIVRTKIKDSCGLVPHSLPPNLGALRLTSSSRPLTHDPPTTARALALPYPSTAHVPMGTESGQIFSRPDCGKTPRS